MNSEHTHFIPIIQTGNQPNAFFYTTKFHISLYARSFYFLPNLYCLMQEG